VAAGKGLRSRAQAACSRAPFSDFNGITSDAPMVMFPIGDGMAGKAEDTHRNLRANTSYVGSVSMATKRESALAQRIFRKATYSGD